MKEMKRMKFIFTADVHCNRERKSKVLKFLDMLESLVRMDYTDRRHAARLVFAGDFFDSPATVTETSGFAPVLRKMKELADLTDIYMIYGTPGHEAMGAYAPFETLGIHVHSSAGTDLISDGETEVLLMSLPEPRKTDFKGLSVKETKAAIMRYLRGSIDKFVEEKSKAKPRFTLMQYHGEVTGAVYQNGEKAGTSPSSYALPLEWIKEIEPDFCGCGHIHLPQRLADNIVYLGSPAPCSFGETHEGRIVVVDCGGNFCKEESVPTGFPVNMTLETDLDGIRDIEKKDLSGKNVKLKITLDKYLKKTFDTEKLREEILRKTNAESLRLAFDYSNAVPERMSGIAEKRSAADKFKVYADTAKISYTDSMIDKINEIQEAMELERSYPTEQLELESLDLRGAIGIKDGQGKDDIFIDFTKYRNGVLALVGPTGAGKTTLIENASPYPRMLTRQGSLKDHFFLKDSHRILVYRTASGKRYRISMLIDGHAKCVGTEYIVEVMDSGSEEWRRLKNISGFETYKDWVNSTFGTFDIFLRTCFSTKDRVKGFENLADAGKTEKMELFSVLAGTDYLSLFAEQAKEKQKELADKAEKTKREMDGYEHLKETVDDCEKTIKDGKAALSTCNKNIEEDKAELAKYRKEQEKFIAVSGSLAMLEQNIRAKTELADNLRSQYDSICAEMRDLEEIFAHKSEYLAQVEWHNENSRKRLELKESIADGQAKLRALRMKLADAESVYSSLSADLNSVEKKKIRLEADIRSLEKSVPEADGKCPVCGALLSEHKKEELEKEKAAAERQLKEKKASLKDCEKKIKELEKKLSSCDIRGIKSDIQKIEDRSAEAQDEIDQIDAYMEGLDIDKAKYAVEKSDDDRLATAIKEKELAVKIEQNDKELSRLNDMDKNQPADWSDKIRRLERGIDDSTQKAASLSAAIKLAERQLDSVKNTKEKMTRITEELEVIQSDIKDYSAIEKAFGNSGIQALELDSAAPEISDIVNSILSETYGERFSVSFDTQRDSASGKKISDFVIKVFDSKVGREKTLDYLSTGEATLVTQTLYYAFSVLRMRRTGFCFKTRFLDESDGSFDPDTRIKYIRMIEAAHKICGASLTVLITHSQEVKDLIEQKIELQGQGS